MTVYADFEGMDGAAEFFARMPGVTNKAARMAINQVAQRGGLKLARDSIMDEIAFPRDYLKGDRLGVTSLATDSKLEAVITGRKRATSLARFAAPGTPIGSAMNSGVRVRVSTKGGGKVLRRAWLVRLNKGQSLDEDNYNVGLAVRLGNGDKVAGKFSAHQSWLVPGVIALLYAPSVDQIFRTVADDIAPQVGDMTAEEFIRQFTRLSQ